MSAWQEDEADIEASRAPLLDHLIELRKRLIWCVASFVVAFVIAFIFSNEILWFLIRPFAVAGELFKHVKPGAHFNPFDLVAAVGNFTLYQHATAGLIATAPLETFFAKMKLAAFGAIVLSFPMLAYQLYRFVAPGLYKRERRAFLPFLFASPTLFLMGAALVYFVMLPFVLWFSLNQQGLVAGGAMVQLLPKVSDYLSLVTTLLLAFGLCFQLPVVLTLLGMAGIVSAQMLSQGRRFAIVGVVVVAAVVTPPDPISQILLATPLVLLYEVSIWCVKLIELRRKREDEAAEAVV